MRWPTRGNAMARWVSWCPDSDAVSGTVRKMAWVLLTMSIAVDPVAAKPQDMPTTVHIFYDNDLHFAPDDSTRYDTDVVTAADKGRVIVRTLDLDAARGIELTGPVRILARVTVRPIAKDVQSVHDKWDRAGNVRLSKPGMADIEIVKFITAYGGITDHEVDVTRLAPLLTGECTFKGSIDTWVSPAWKMDVSLTFAPVPTVGFSMPEWGEVYPPAPDWIGGAFYDASVSEEKTRNGPLTMSVTIPEDLESVKMHYLVSGHCTDGRGADEFVSKDNVITVDGREVYRFKPWRDDCRNFRDVNPYCRRWFDGSWSADFSRSGWCPGDVVAPVEIDLTEHVGPGDHEIGVMIEDIRPRDENGNLGYWRVSSYLLGWTDAP